MKQVEVSYTLDASRESIAGRLSPEAIVEYEGTYEVISVKETDGECRISVSNDTIEGDHDMVLTFTETETGYVYRQVGDGLFETLSTEIVLEGDEHALVTVRSEFTFGGPLAFVKDWLAAGYRRAELEKLVRNVSRDHEASESAVPNGSSVEEPSDG
ncbi:hypothetical protein [Halorubrum sp. DTA98]|uniref:hypothetical protein n=1 Tax=Halorubrum sp. DTA98 TaxID=3402163 RepID=UPI003AAF651B